MPSDLQISNIRDLNNANSAITIASDGQITVNQNNPTIQLGSNATFPAGHVVKTTFVLRTGGTLEKSDNSITTACSAQYTCDSASNKIVLMGLGVLNRKGTTGEGAIYYYIDGDVYGEYQNRDFKDNDEMPVHNITFDAFSGQKEILLKIQSLSNNNRVAFSNGNGFAILEIQQ